MLPLDLLHARLDLVDVEADLLHVGEELVHLAPLHVDGHLVPRHVVLVGLGLQHGNVVTLLQKTKESGWMLSTGHGSRSYKGFVLSLVVYQFVLAGVLTVV